MSERKVYRKKVTQGDVVNAMANQKPGVYSVSKIYGVLVYCGFSISMAGVRNHLGKMESAGFIGKMIKSGLVSFEFYSNTKEVFDIRDKEKREEFAITCRNMKSRESEASKKGKLYWGKRIIGTPGTSVSMMSL